MTYTKPLPTISTTSRPYWEGARAGRLLLPVCDACGHTWFPPSKFCPRCLSPEVSWKQASGRGRLWSWNVFHRAYFPGFRDSLPYLTVLIELEEGPFMTSSLIESDLAELACDLPVVVEFDPVTDEITLPMFRIASGAEAQDSHATREYDHIVERVSGHAL